MDYLQIRIATGMSTSTIQRILRDINRYNTFTPRRELSRIRGTIRLGRPRRITNNAIYVIRYIIAMEPTLFVDEIADIIGYELHEWYSTRIIRYWMKRMGYTKKVVWKVMF